MAAPAALGVPTDRSGPSVLGAPSSLGAVIQAIVALFIPPVEPFYGVTVIVAVIDEWTLQW